jgi:hypothetical protein
LIASQNASTVCYTQGHAGALVFGQPNIYSIFHVLYFSVPLTIHDVTCGCGFKTFVRVVPFTQHAFDVLMKDAFLNVMFITTKTLNQSCTK